MSSKPMHSARITLPARFNEKEIALLAPVFEDGASAVAAVRVDHKKDTDWQIEWIMENPLEPVEMTARLMLQAAVYDLDINIAATDWSVEEIPEKNWLQESYKQFPAFTVGSFFIYGAHYEGKIPTDKMGLQIDAATAFGSGEHGTTAGCLQAMAELESQGICPWNVLDMGTGSGILGIAAWKLWKTMVLGVDNDNESVRVAAHHRDINNIPDDATGMTCQAGDGFRAKAVKEKAPFDLIIANILAGTLIEMAHDLKQVSDENGFVILSGILNEQADSVLSVYEAEDFKLINRYEIEGWTTLVLQN